MSLMRYTIVHDNGGVSFVGDEFMLPALVAACRFAFPATRNHLVLRWMRSHTRGR